MTDRRLATRSSAPGRRRAHRLAVGAGLAAVFALGLVACATPTANDTRSATAGLPDTRQSLVAREWLLDPGDSSVVVEVGRPVTLTFDAGDRLAGTAPCNTYHGTYQVEGASLRVDDLAWTERACEAPVMEAEEAYLAALGEVERVDARRRDRLVLEGAGGVRLAYDAVDVYAELLGTWDVVEVGVSGERSPAVPGTEPTLTFRSGGELDVDTGCNPMRATWALEARDVSVELRDRAPTECPTPPGVTAQEEALAAALEGVHRVDVAGPVLTLVDPGGRPVLVAERR